ncbi:hypothetical protein KA005_76135 [bacterium]|nr:hypothetical protein [bacterium]
MKRIICTLLIVLILFSGCTPTRNLYPLNSEKCADFNEKFSEQGATLTIIGSDEDMDIENVRVGVDSSHWIDSDNQAHISVPTDVIRDITIADHQAGLLYGLVCSGLLTLMIVANPPEEEEKEDIPLGEWIQDFAPGLGFAIGLIIIMPVAGYIRGQDYRYIVQNPIEGTYFQAIEHLIDTDNKDRALDSLNKIIDESQVDLDITIAHYLKIKHELGDPLADYQKLKTIYPDNIYTSLAADLLIERGVAEPYIMATGQTQEQEFPELAQAQEISGYHQHDGFFLRFHAGPSSGKMVVENFLGTERTKKGLTGAYRFQLGTTIAENLILYAEAGEFDIYASDPGWETYMGTTEEVDIFVFNYGAGLSYYFMPSNYYLSGSFSLCSNKIRTTANNVENTTDSGWGLYLSAGKEWWVSPNWGLGLAGFAHYSQTSGKEPSYNEEYTIKNTVFGIVFSATYH